MGTGETQVMAIRDSQGGTTTVEIDYAQGFTRLTPPTGITETFTGVPNGVVYTKGRIDDFGGPDRSGSTVLPAVATRARLNMVATGDVMIRRDLTVQDYDAAENVLGIFTSGGNVRVTTNAPDDIRVDAYVMARPTARCSPWTNTTGATTAGRCTSAAG